MGRKINIFLIYTSDDNDIMLRLLRHVQPLKELHDISIWHDDPIYTGQLWKPQIESRLNDADIFLFLVSDAFMHSEFIDQSEFKRAIDRYKEGNSKVIPILIDNCPWDIEFRSDDYNFNFKELQVLPEQGKPIVDWASPDEALDKITAAVALVIASLMDDADQGEAEKIIEVTPANADGLDQKEINSTEEREADSIAKEEHRDLAEAEAQIKAGEEKRLKQEVDAKRRTEEEKRLKEEAEAQRKSEEEKRFREEAEAQRKSEEEKRLKQEIDAKRRAEEEKRLSEKAEAQRKSDEKNKLKEEANGPQIHIEADSKVEETQEDKNKNFKKRVIAVSLIAVFAIGGIWFISFFNNGSEKHTPPLPKENTSDVKDSSALSENENDSVKEEESLSKLGIGASYDGGIVFSISSDGKTGKIVSPRDAGPMAWKNAMNIHEQLGEGWRLPTLDELKTMYQTIGQGATNSGQFADGLYWSATFYDEYQARLLRFSDGNASYHYNRGVEQRKFRVRAVWDFSR